MAELGGALSNHRRPGASLPVMDQAAGRPFLSGLSPHVIAVHRVPETKVRHHLKLLAALSQNLGQHVLIPRPFSFISGASIRISFHLSPTQVTLAQSVAHNKQSYSLTTCCLSSLLQISNAPNEQEPGKSITHKLDPTDDSPTSRHHTIAPASILSRTVRTTETSRSGTQAPTTEDFQRRAPQQAQ